MTWNFVVGAVSTTLPVAPKIVKLRTSAVTKEYLNPTGRQILISFGKKADKLVLEGAITQAGQTSQQLQTNYLDELASMVYKSVTITAPDTRYDGDWILVGFEYEERGGFTAAFWYKLEFLKGEDGASGTPGIVVT